MSGERLGLGGETPHYQLTGGSEVSQQMYIAWLLCHSRGPGTVVVLGALIVVRALVVTEEAVTVLIVTGSAVLVLFYRRPRRSRY